MSDRTPVKLVELVGSMKPFLAKSSGTATDEELRASAESYSIHDHMIRATIRRLHKDPDVVDDLAQETWAELMEGLASLRLDPALGSVTGWVVKTANNIAKMHVRRLANRRQGPLTPEETSELADPEPGPDIEFELKENEAQLRALIEAFAASLAADHDQRVVRLYWLKEYSLSRIAVDMMISEDSAWGILRRVSVKLADYLRREGYDGRSRENNKILRISRR